MERKSERTVNGCELCDREARMYCESDQASLCWECDAKVHGANFLVARHTRVLLCQRCQAPTPWKASGARLSPTVSVCERCYACGKDSSVVEAEDRAGESGEERMVEDEEDYYEDDASDTYEEEEDEEEEDEEEEGENQVVPWSPTSPPPASFSSAGSSTTGRFGSDLLKRMRENADLASQHDITCSSSHLDNLVAAPQPPMTFSARSAASTSLSSYRSKDRCSLLLDATPPSAADEVTGDLISICGNHSTVNLVSSASLSPPI